MIATLPTLLHSPGCVVHQSFNMNDIWFFPILNRTQDPESQTVHRIIIALVLIRNGVITRKRCRHWAPSKVSNLIDLRLIHLFVPSCWLQSDIYWFLFMDVYGIRTYFITGCFWIDCRLPCFPFVPQDVFWENDLLKISFDPDDLPRTLVKGLNVEQQPADQWHGKMMTSAIKCMFHLLSFVSTSFTTYIEASSYETTCFLNFCPAEFRDGLVCQASCS